MTPTPIEKFLPREEKTLREVVRSLADIALLLSSNGVVQNAFARADHPASAFVDDWVAGDFRDTLTMESQPKLDRALRDFADAKRASTVIEVNHSMGEVFGLPVRYSLHAIGDEDVLLVGRDRQEVAAAQQKLLAAQITTEREGQKQRHIGTTLAAVLDAIPEPLFILNQGTGRVEDANPSGNMLLGRNGGRRSTIPFDEFAELSDGKLRLKSDASGPYNVERLQFRRGADRMSIVILYEEMPGRRAEPEDAFDGAAMAIATTDHAGRLTSTNPAFERLAGNSSGDRTHGRNIAELLQRGPIDEQVILAAVDREGFLGEFQTVLTAGHAPIAVNLTAFALDETPSAQIAWIFRPLSDVQASGQSEVSQMLTEMVGTMPLSDIIDETTVEIERVCIEEALKRTRNNRAAAAEMLGLSRQSLYVRLRRFGLESKSRQ